MLKAALNGLYRSYIQLHGVKALAAKRVEPMKFVNGAHHVGPRYDEPPVRRETPMVGRHAHSLHLPSPRMLHDLDRLPPRFYSRERLKRSHVLDTR